jgi:hypothetical protein
MDKGWERTALGLAVMAGALAGAFEGTDGRFLIHSIVAGAGMGGFLRGRGGALAGAVAAALAGNLALAGQGRWGVEPAVGSALVLGAVGAVVGGLSLFVWLRGKWWAGQARRDRERGMREVFEGRRL